MAEPSKAHSPSPIGTGNVEQVNPDGDADVIRGSREVVT